MIGFSLTIVRGASAVASTDSPVVTASGATDVALRQFTESRAKLAPERGHQPASAGRTSAAMTTNAGVRTRSLRTMFRTSYDKGARGEADVPGATP
jgi:hypothetical protein